MDNKEKFLNWLKSDETIYKNNNSDCIFVKYPYSDNIYLIYNSYNGVGIGYDLSYCGIYDKEKDILYDIDYVIRKVLNISYLEPQPYHDSNDIYKELKDKISQYIVDYVYENKSEFYAAAENYEACVSKEDIYNNFILGTSDFRYSPVIDTLNKQDILKYLSDEQFVYEFSYKYIKEQKEIIGMILKDNDLKNECLKDLESDQTNSLHKARTIRKLLDNSDSATVHVFINKNDINFDFRYDTKMLKYSCSNSYISTYHMSCSDRKKYYNFFGNDDFSYKDIYKIEYRNKVIYEDENFIFDENDYKEEEYSL